MPSLFSAIPQNAGNGAHSSINRASIKAFPRFNAAGIYRMAKPPFDAFSDPIIFGEKSNAQVARGKNRKARET
ncbi:hypothetical protein [Paraburkholderia sp.]|uniref:hypothetical protein n=1 Tax=Paraburkholderia sp. TaxID=1926495 RepID=UPI00239EE183|nr:hypothetical protein [Paraburkholderia sp.]MDE1180635.1 hypothetical protein [Paraburkholderia sp.]